MRPLPGTVHLQKVRCGKKNCRCAVGLLHPAYFRFWREGGRLRKAYVRKGDLEATRAACAAYRHHNSLLLATINGPGSAEVRRQIRAMLREAVGDNPGRERIARRLAPPPRVKDSPSPDVVDALEATGMLQKRGLPPSRSGLHLPMFRFG